MQKSKYVKFVIYVPESYADLVREAMGMAGAGKVGHYSFSTFSIKGIGRFKPEPGAHPTIGKIGRLEKVREERIEAICERKIIKKAIQDVKKVHPYEEMAYDIYPLEI